MDNVTTARMVALAQLGATLRTLRESSGLSGKALGRRTQMSQSKISKIENGKASPTAKDIELILGALQPDSVLAERVLRQYDSLDLPDGDFERIIALGVSSRQAEFLEREANSYMIRSVETAVVPGLLQTPDYSQAIYETFVPPVTTDIAAAVRTRMTRQEILWDTDRRFEFLIHESALWSMPGSLRTQLAQLDRLIQLSGRPNISIGIITVGVKLPLLVHAFHVIDEVYASAETLTAELSVISHRSISVYLQAFRALSDVAVTRDAGQRIAEIQQALEVRAGESSDEQ